MWLCGKPGKCIVEFFDSAGLGEVSCVDEYVAFWERRLGVVRVVRVRYADNANVVASSGEKRGGIARILRSAQPVNPTNNEQDGRRCEAFPCCRWSAIEDTV